MRFTPVNLDSVFPCNSWFKWWVVGNFLADPSKVCPSHQRPLLRGLNRFFMIHAVRRTANDHSSVALPTDTDPWRRVLLLSMSIPAWQFLEYKIHCPLLAMITMANRIFSPASPTAVSAGAASDLACWLGRLTCETTPVLWKRMSGRFNFDSEPTWGILTMRFKFFNFVQCRFSRFVCDDVFNLRRRAVRIYVCACQNRFQLRCGFPPPRLFVAVGLA